MADRTDASTATPPQPGPDFIRQIVADDAKTGKHGGRVVTRFRRASAIRRDKLARRGIRGASATDAGRGKRHVSRRMLFLLLLLPTPAAGWQQVLSVRVALLARIGQYEKPSSGANCGRTVADAVLPSSGQTELVITALALPWQPACGTLEICVSCNRSRKPSSTTT